MKSSLYTGIGDVGGGGGGGHEMPDCHDQLGNDLEEIDSGDELYDEDNGLNGSGLGAGSNLTGIANNGAMFIEDDKRKRRAIANSNERRRMQSINAGFQTLKSLIPHSSGEKLSKVSLCLFNIILNHPNLVLFDKFKIGLYSAAECRFYAVLVE